MNDKTLRVLEYHKIIEKLSLMAQTSMGKQMCLDLMPSSDIYEVRERLSETLESYDVVLKWGNLPLEGAKNIADVIKKAKMEYVLTPGQLLKVSDTMRCMKNIKNFMKEGTKRESYPIIYEIVEALVYIKPLQEKIEAAIISEDEVSDRASEKLYSLRRSIKDKNAKVREKLQSMVQSYSKYLQDPIVTIRGERYVIPVKSECRGSVPGLVHDQSASGSTLFIEPMAVVELNNDIKELMLNEKAEVERILYELSVIVSQNADYLEIDNDSVGYLDFLMSKAKFGLNIDGTIPVVNDRGIINIKSAKHPLINKDIVVAIDIKLGESYGELIITGPNTGGKTVTLKTTGLLTLMAMSGLAIPATDGSVVSIFNKVFADIGDEQSIEQSLSTFSSHMTNIVDILKNADSRSLVLVDELGAGTDPTEGAALAMSILKKLYDKGAKVVATTHYSEIKVFAMEEQGFENASVEFDVETLRPTYRLLIGVPGKSNAFEISKRLGLSEDIVQTAREMISNDAAKFEDVIQSLQSKIIIAEKEAQEAQRLRIEVQEIRKDLADKKYKIDNQRDKIISQAQEQAKRTLKQAKEQSDIIIKELNELRTKATDSASLKQAQDARKKLNDKLGELDQNEIALKDVKDGMIPLKTVKVGEEVYITTISQKGIAITSPDSRGNVQVQIGFMKMSVSIDNLMKDITKITKKQARKTGATKLAQSKSISVSSSIDLRGQTIDEAMYNIDKYLDDAYLGNIESVTLIHGKGTGALRAGIQSELKSHHLVKSSRMGDISEGGSGVTIVELKK